MSSFLAASGTFTLTDAAPQILPVSDGGVTHLLVKANNPGIYIGFGNNAGENFFSELPASGYELVEGKEYEFVLGPTVGPDQGTNPTDTVPYVATQSATAVSISVFATVVY